MKKQVFSISLFLMSLLWISSAHAQSEWLSNPWFTDPALQFDTGIIRNQNVGESPDNWKWGYSCYKWDNNGVYPIDWCHVKAYYAGQSDYNVYIAGDSLGTDKTGVVKLVQGNVWGGSVPWYVLPKIPVDTPEIYVDAWYKVVSYTGLHTAFMFDIWLKDDSTGNIMVLDLIFFVSTYSPIPIKSPWWDGKVFHYQASVCGIGGWYHCNFKLDQFIDDAISKAESQGVHFNRKTTYIYQSEILFELIHGVAELDVGGFRLYWQPNQSYTSCEAEGGECMMGSGGCRIACKDQGKWGYCELGDPRLGYYPGCGERDCCCFCIGERKTTMIGTTTPSERVEGAPLSTTTPIIMSTTIQGMKGYNVRTVYLNLFNNFAIVIIIVGIIVGIILGIIYVIMKITVKK